MLSLTAHCISSDFIRKSFVLQSTEFNGSHTGEKIANLITTCLQSWKVDNKLVCIVRDNGSNFVAGLRDSGLPNISCLAHTLQLVIDDGVLAQPCVVNVLAAARRLVGHFKRSNVNLHALTRIQQQLGLKQHRLIQDEPTRWNTSYYMLDRLIEQRQAICAAEIECKINTELSSQSWQLAEKVVKVLKPFEEATTAVSAEGSSAALIIPVVNSLIHFLENMTSDEDEGIRTMKGKMLLSIKTRFAAMETNKLYLLPTLLDPRFKIRVFSSQTAIIQARQCLIEECIVLQSSISEALVNDSSPAAKRRHLDGMSDPEFQKESSLWSSFDSMIQTGEETDAASSESYSSAEVNVEKYLKEPNQPRESSPVTYWKEKMVLYPILGKLATKYLSIPAASVASERLFSAAKNIITDQRNCLDPNRAEMLLFIHKNLQLFTS